MTAADIDVEGTVAKYAPTAEELKSGAGAFYVGRELAEIGLAVAPYQLYEPLDAPTEDALKASIRRWGVLVPVVVNQNGQIIDGHHRAVIAHQLGVVFERRVIEVADEDEARELARTLNEDRRQLPPEKRRLVVADLREQGHSTRAVAKALGVDQSTVVRDQHEATAISPDAEASREIGTNGLDGKTYGKAPETKRCSSCRESKPLESFGRDRTAADGRGYECRVCAAERLKGDANADKVLARQAEVKQLRASGMTRAQIAAQLGVTERTISSDFAALGLDAKPPKAPGRVERAAQRRAEVKRLYEQGKQTSEIAALLGAPVSTIGQDISDMGIARLPMTPEAISERQQTVRDLAATSYTSRQIAKRVGVSENAVKEIAKRLGIDIPADKAVGRTKRIDPTHVVEQICLDAVNATFSVGVIDLDYTELDPDRLDEWVSSLEQAIKSLQTFKRRLIKELTR